MTEAPAWLWIPYALAALSLCFLLVPALRGHGQVASRGVALGLIGAIAWCTVDVATALMASGRLSTGYFMLAKSTALAAVTLCVSGVWISARSLASPSWRPGRLAWWTVGVLPLLWLLLGLSSPWTHAVFLDATTTRPGRWWVQWQPGPAFWVFLVVVLAVTGSLVVKLQRGGRDDSGLSRHRAAAWSVVGLAVAGPAIGYVWVTRGAIPDLSPLAVPVIAYLSLYQDLRRGWYGLAPVARGFVWDRLSDAVLIVDGAGRVIDGNPVGYRLIGELLPDNPQPLAGTRIGPHLEGVPALSKGGECHVEVAGRATVLHVSADDLLDAKDRLLARAFVIREVSELAAEREALRSANVELEQQLGVVEQLRAQLAEQALRDQVTGLHNRHHLMPHLEAAVGHALGAGEPLSVLLLDLDHFKSVNDEHGHATGDRLLRTIATALRTTLDGEEHLLARYGGEEFVVVLPGHEPGVVAARAEQCRAACAAAQAPGHPQPVRRTVSIGIADLTCLPVGHRLSAAEIAAHLLDIADSALYDAKHAGRNRVVAALPSELPGPSTAHRLPRDLRGVVGMTGAGSGSPG